MAPYDASTVENSVAAIGKRTQGGALLVVGDFNTNLVATEGQERDNVISAALE